jgi:hypothetical protein
MKLTNATFGLQGLLQLEQAEVIVLALWWQKRELKQFFIYSFAVQYTSVSAGQGQHRRVMTSPSRTLP